MNLSLNKAERLAKTEGLRGWSAMFSLLAIMCFDQFVAEVPFINIVFPVLVICAASMNSTKNLVLVALYTLVFELSCVAWLPTELVRVQWWTLEVFIGFMMPLVTYKIFNFRHRDMKVVSYAAIAAMSELLYFGVSVAATAVIWHIDPVAYYLSDIAYELVGSAVTFVCTLPVAAAYKLSTGELSLPRAERKILTATRLTARG